MTWNLGTIHAKQKVTIKTEPENNEEDGMPDYWTEIDIDFPGIKTECSQQSKGTHEGTGKCYSNIFVLNRNYNLFLSFLFFLISFN